MSITKKVAQEFVVAQSDAIKKRLEVQSFDKDAAAAAVVDFMKGIPGTYSDYNAIAMNKGLVADILGGIYGKMATRTKKLRDAEAGMISGKKVGRQLAGIMKDYTRGRRTVEEHKMSNEEFAAALVKKHTRG